MLNSFLRLGTSTTYPFGGHGVSHPGAVRFASQKKTTESNTKKTTKTTKKKETTTKNERKTTFSKAKTRVEGSTATMTEQQTLQALLKASQLPTKCTWTSSVAMEIAVQWCQEIVLEILSQLFRSRDTASKQKSVQDLVAKYAPPKKLANTVKIPEKHFMHVRQEDGSVITERGPQEYTIKQGDQVLCKPQPMIFIKPNEFCFVKGKDGSVTRKFAVDSPLVLNYGDSYDGPHQCATLTEKQGVHLEAKNKCRFVTSDRRTVHYEPGQRWLHIGSMYKLSDDYFPVKVVNEIDLTENAALIKRQDGKEELLTPREYLKYFLKPGEELVRTVQKTTISELQYAVLQLDNGKREVITADHQPKDIWHPKVTVKKAIVVQDNETLLVVAKENFNDNGKQRVAGESWIVEGPTVFTCAYAVTATLRKDIAIGDGVYILNKKTGEITVKTPENCKDRKLHLDVDEVLWTEKKVPPQFPARKEKYHVVKYSVKPGCFVIVKNTESMEKKVHREKEDISLGPAQELVTVSLPALNGLLKHVFEIPLECQGETRCKVTTEDGKYVEVQVVYTWFLGGSDDNLKHVESNMQIVDDIISERIKRGVEHLPLKELHSKLLKAVLEVPSDSSVETVGNSLVFKNQAIQLYSFSVRKIDPTEAVKKIQRVSNVLLLQDKEREEHAKHQQDSLHQKWERITAYLEEPLKKEYQIKRDTLSYQLQRHCHEAVHITDDEPSRTLDGVVLASSNGIDQPPAEATQ